MGQGKTNSKPKGAIGFAKLKTIENNQLREMCFHEAGHYSISEFYGGRPSCTLQRVGDPTASAKSWAGGTGIGFGHTPYELSVIGWAGTFAERLAGFPADKWEVQIDHVAGDVSSAFQVEDFIEAGVSPTDLNLIHETKQFEKSFKRACDLVVARRRGIIAFAEHMFAKYSPEIEKRYT